MNIMFLLMADFETPSILLADISEHYLGMKPATADKKAGYGDLPLATFRIGDGQRFLQMVHVSNLAEFIDKRKKEAKKEIKKMR